MKSIRLTVAQAVIKYLNQQYVEREGKENKFFAGCFGILGHGNVAGMGQAIQQQNDLKYYQCRNEQSMVHTAAAYAKMKNRLSTFICTTSIGPGATNMITAAAGATINRLPVLLIPSDIFGKRNVAPVLQQLESANSQDIPISISRFNDPGTPDLLSIIGSNADDTNSTHPAKNKRLSAITKGYKSGYVKPKVIVKTKEKIIKIFKKKYQYFLHHTIWKKLRDYAHQ